MPPFLGNEPSSHVYPSYIHKLKTWRSPWCLYQRGWRKNTASFERCRVGLAAGCLAAGRRSTLKEGSQVHLYKRTASKLILLSESSRAASNSDVLFQLNPQQLKAVQMLRQITTLPNIKIHWGPKDWEHTENLRFQTEFNPFLKWFKKKHKIVTWWNNLHYF